MPGSGSVPSNEVAEARELLRALLEAAYGSAGDAGSAVERALQHARLAEPPASVAELLVFARTHLLPVLSEDLGPRLAMTVLDDFIAKEESRSGIRTKKAHTPASTPLGRVKVRARPKAGGLNVLLVDADRVSRSALARSLLRESCQVTVIGSLEELGPVVRAPENVDVVVLDDRVPARLLVMEAVVDRFPNVSLVVRSAAEEATRALLDALGVARHAVVPGHATSEQIVAATLMVAPSPAR